MLNLPPTPAQVAAENVKQIPKPIEPVQFEEPVTLQQLQQVFNTVMPTQVAAPLDQEDLNRRIQEANKALEEEGFSAADLLHSAIVVFEQQRYYEVSKLFFYSENVYENLCKTIVDSNAVSLNIKKALPVFNDVGFPKSVSIDSPTKSIKVSLFDKKTYIKIAVEISFFNGRNCLFISHFDY